MASSKLAEAVNTVLMRKSTREEQPEYQNALNEDFGDDRDGEAEWMKYIEAKDRETMRLPLAGWMPALPLLGKKVGLLAKGGGGVPQAGPSSFSLRCATCSCEGREQQQR